MIVKIFQLEREVCVMLCCESLLALKLSSFRHCHSDVVETQMEEKNIAVEPRAL